jgi:integrase
MSIRKRSWNAPSGEIKEAWIVDFRDQKGKRTIKTFARKREAENYAITVKVQLRDGTYVADSDSTTVAEAGAMWINAGDNDGLERSTRDQRRQHVDLHIVPYLGHVRLSQLTAPMVRGFEDDLRRDDRSPAMVRKVRTSLGAILTNAVELGLATRNPVRDLRSRRRRGVEQRAERRAKGRLKVGVDFPTPDEIKAIIKAASDRWRPFLMTAILTGLRASELRGLRWSDVDLAKSEIHVRQRADKRRRIGPPKSEAGERTVPIPRGLVAALREWKAACPKGPLGLVFPNKLGHVIFYGDLIDAALLPTMIAAGVSVIAKDAGGHVLLGPNGKPIRNAKYTGLHSLRHFYASWCINRKIDGGLELPAKVVQERLGHSTIGMTLDTYGHLFPRGDDRDELTTAETALLS